MTVVVQANSLKQLECTCNLQSAQNAFPMQCYGSLCNQSFASGGCRRQAEKSYGNKCPACYHHASGTTLQSHCAYGTGVEGYCRNYPGCDKWLRARCNGFCVGFLAERVEDFCGLDEAGS